MYGRSGLDRFKKAQSSEPFSVTPNSSPKTVSHSAPIEFAKTSQQSPYQSQQLHVAQNNVTPSVGPNQPVTQVGGGQSNWKPPDWAIEPRPGVYYLEVLKDGEVLDRINLDKRRHIFGRQIPTCDFVLDHQSVSRQHAAVVPHKNGSIYVIDLGAAHGTFVANERLNKDIPAELEVGQSLRFAASTRTYVLRKNNAALFAQPSQPTEINLPPLPDPSDEEAVLEYNTVINRYGLGKPDLLSSSAGDRSPLRERPAKRRKKTRVVFRDQVGGELVEVVGISDGVDVETEPGPLGFKEGSLVGKYESLVHTTVIPKGQEHVSLQKYVVTQNGVTDRLLEVLNNVKTTPKSGIYEDIYGDSLSGKVTTSWGNTLAEVYPAKASSEEVKSCDHAYDENDDDLFGD